MPGCVVRSRRTGRIPARRHSLSDFYNAASVILGLDLPFYSLPNIGFRRRDKLEHLLVNIARELQFRECAVNAHGLLWQALYTCEQSVANRESDVTEVLNLSQEGSRSRVWEPMKPDFGGIILWRVRIRESEFC